MDHYWWPEQNSSEMIFLTATLLIAHIVLVGTMWLIWTRIPEAHADHSLPDPPMVSVIVPVRNEQCGIKETLASIVNNTAGKQTFEVIVVNDHSTDGTPKIVADFISEYSSVSMIHLDATKFGKKSAISAGVDIALGDVVIITDGDTKVPPQWIESYQHAYHQQPSLKMAFGPVVYAPTQRAFFGELLNTELMVLVGVGAGTLALGYPTMINGANMSFRKQAFLQLRGFEGSEEIPTGDDEFLLRKVTEAHPKGVKFLKSRGCTVFTSAPANAFDFFHQRRRWASKWKLHDDWASKLLPLFVFAFNALVLYWYMGFLTGQFRNVAIAVMLVMKMVIEFVFVQKIGDSLGKRVPIAGVLGLQIIYPVYVVFFAIASNFGKYRWKNRIFSVHQPRSFD